MLLAALSVSSGNCESIDYEALEEELGALGPEDQGGETQGNEESEARVARDSEELEVLLKKTKEILKQQKGGAFLRKDLCLVQLLFCGHTLAVD